MCGANLTAAVKLHPVAPFFYELEKFMNKYTGLDVGGVIYAIHFPIQA